MALALSLVLSLGSVVTYASGLDPYIGFSATAIDDYQSSHASFSVSSGKLGGIWAGEWACYKGLDFGDMSPLSVEVSVGVPEGYSNAVELRIDAPDGARIASVPITPSGTFSVAVPCRADLERAVTGVHDLYVTNAKSTSDIYEIKFFKPREAGADIPKFVDTDAYTDIADDANRREINILYQLGILSDYEDAAFAPLLPVTRGEFARSMFKLYGEEETEGMYETGFDDVASDKSCAQAVLYLKGLGIISSNADKMFRPDDFIRYAEAVTMLCRVLEYDVAAQKQGGYPSGYLRVAAAEGFAVSGLGADDFLRRSQMAKLIYESFSADALTATGVKGDKTSYEKQKGILYKSQQIYTDRGKVSMTWLSGLYAPRSDLKKNEVIIDGAVYQTGTTNATAMLGFECEYFYRQESDGTRVLCAIAPMAGVEIYEISPQSLDSITDSGITYWNEKGKKVTLAIHNQTAVLYNGVAVDDSLANLVESVSDFCGTVTVIENRDGNHTLMIDEYVNHVIGSINLLDAVLTDADTQEKITADADKDQVFIKKGEDILQLSDLEEGEIISVFASKNKSGDRYLRIYVGTDEVSGEIAMINAEDNTAVIDGVSYPVSPYCTDSFTVRQSGIFKLDAFGYIAAYTFAEDSGRLLGLYLDSAFDGNGLNTAAKVKIVTESGKAEVFELADRVTLDGIRLTKTSDMINGNALYPGLAALAKEKPLRYSLNAAKKINWMDTLHQGDGSTNDMLCQLTRGDNITHNYRGGIMSSEVTADSGSYSLGQYYIANTSTMFTYFANARSEDENWKMAQIGNSMGKSAYPKGEVYSTTGESYCGDVFVWRNRDTSTEYIAPFVFTEMATAVNSEGETVYYVKGIDGRAKVSYLLTADAYDSGICKGLLAGDTVRVKLNEEKEIFSAECLVLRDGTTARGTLTPSLSDETRVPTGTDRDTRYLYGTVTEKGTSYLAVNVGMLTVSGTAQQTTEVIERTAADVVVVSCDAGSGRYLFDYGLTADNITQDDTIFAYLNDGATKLIVVYRDVTLS